MGFFRRVKVKRYTEWQLAAHVAAAQSRIFSDLLGESETEEALVNWAVWREALARKRGEKSHDA